MFGIGYFKAQPTEFVRKVAGGRVKSEGQALSFCQSLLAFNDLFVGRKTHISARYHLRHGRRSGNQSSSGIIVSTGAGSTGWLSSVLNGAAGVVEPFAGKKAVAPVREGFRFAWDAPRLCFSVREPFVSKASAGA
jgi:hypothetical protein